MRILVAILLGLSPVASAQRCDEAMAGEHRVEVNGVVHPWRWLSGKEIRYRNVDSVVYPYPSSGIVVAADAAAGTVTLAPEWRSDVGPVVLGADLQSVAEPGSEEFLPLRVVAPER